jgi:DsbC/DsbD-like thiol-disulfide interchange protein
MKSALFAAAILTLTASAETPATAIWIAETMTVKPGEPIRTAIVMKVSEGWHTYWENPGEGGMPLDIKAALPEGWVIGEILHPVPKRFMTGDLPGFGYEGEIHFPLTLTAPDGFIGALPKITATLSWLTCNDETCLPGEAELALAAAPEAKGIADAFAALPQPIPDAKLTVASDEKNILISLVAPLAFDASVFEIFPATRNVIDPSANTRFIKGEGNIWRTTAPKSEYLDGEPKDLRLVLTAPGKGAWKISTAD